MSDTNDTVESEPVGNTKKRLRARFWCFTWNGYPENWNDTLTQAFADAKKYVWQPEVGASGNKHIQGYVEFDNARSFESMKKAIPQANFSQSRSKAAITYCMKTDTKDGQTQTKGFFVPKPLIEKFHEWQLTILDAFKGEPHPRKILWVVDPIGGGGKTTFCKHLCNTRVDTIYIAGKASDMKYGIASWINELGKTLKVVLLDYTRSLEGYISYEGIEAVKNGIFYNTKYKSGQVIFDIPHVVCFSNFMPEIERLSKDRWEVMVISELMDGNAV